MAEPIEDLERRLIAVALELGVVAEVCWFVDYDPAVGRVPEHWRLRHDVMQIAKAAIAFSQASNTNE